MSMDLLIEAIEKTKNEYQWKTVYALLEDYELRRRGELLLVDVSELHDMFEAFTLQVSETYREIRNQKREPLPVVFANLETQYGKDYVYEKMLTHIQQIECKEKRVNS